MKIIKEIAQKAVDYLISIQRQDGAWTDYRLPVGESDHWVTAFTAFGVLIISEKLNYYHGVESTKKAACFLQESQHYKAGWGYNKHVGVDADSTAHVIRLFRALNINIKEGDSQCLMSFYNGNGAFSTYRNDSGWGQPHPDVTASAALALDPGCLDSIRHDLLTYCYRMRMDDGMWPSYWWKNHQYGTFLMCELYRKINEPLDLNPAKATVIIQSCFDLVWAIGLLVILNHKGDYIDWAVKKMKENQDTDGKWPGSPSLRVTDPQCSAPWRKPAGDYYTDYKGTITTSSALRVLAYLL